MNGVTVLLTGKQEARQLFEGEFGWLVFFWLVLFCFSCVCMSIFFKVVLVSGVQHSDSDIYMYLCVCILFKDSFPLDVITEH